MQQETKTSRKKSTPISKIKTKQNKKSKPLFKNHISFSTWKRWEKNTMLQDQIQETQHITSHHTVWSKNSAERVRERERKAERLTSVEPEGERLGGGALRRLGEVVEEAPPGLLVDVDVSGELPEPDDGLPRQPRHQILLREPPHTTKKNATNHHRHRRRHCRRRASSQQLNCALAAADGEEEEKWVGSWSWSLGRDEEQCLTLGDFILGASSLFELGCGKNNNWKYCFFKSGLLAHKLLRV